MLRLLRAPALLLVAFCFLVLPARAEGPAVKIEFRLAEDKPADGLIAARDPYSKKPIYLHKEAVLTGKDIAEASPSKDSNDQPALAITFTTAGGKKMAEATSKNIRKRLAILVDGKVLSAPVILDSISTRTVLSGKFTQKQVEELAKRLGRK